MVRFICSLFFAAATTGRANDGIALVMPPNVTTGKPVSIVMIGGAQISNTAYRQMLEQVQEEAGKLGISLWAGAPWYAGNVPNPVDMKQRVEEVQSELIKAGLPQDAPSFYGAHSLGTVFLQDYVKSLGGKAAGQILMGGWLVRKQFDPDLDYPVPTLTIGAELDGLARITRIAEAYYHQKKQADAFPTVVLPGQNHMQFASGTPPANVMKNDLPAEVDEADAHVAIGSTVADFMAQRLSLSDSGRSSQRAQVTVGLLDPIVKAYELEGSRRFNAPAQFGGPDEKQCIRGLCPSSSPWAPKAQQLISESALKEADPKVSLDVGNAYVLLSGSPVTGQDFHLPNVTKTSENVIRITTYSQCYWNDKIDEVLEDFDTGFTFTSAQEIGTKLLSRQCSLNVGLGLNVSFSVDDPDFCAQTNQEAYNWALANAPSQSIDRFKRQGTLMVMGQDIQKSGGPWWINGRLEFNQKVAEGRNVVEVASPAAKTEQDYWKDHFHIPKPAFIPDPGCYHYCKLLSPARAMEWIMVDGLRQKKMQAEQILI
jgi:hypothetical protein